jgi:hypothetical protein
MVQPITGKPMLPGNLAKNLRFAEIVEGDPAVATMPAREDIKASRFRQGARCLGAYRNDELLGLPLVLHAGATRRTKCVAPTSLPMRNGRCSTSISSCSRSTAWG